jgi:hypothetical protein
MLSLQPLACLAQAKALPTPEKPVFRNPAPEAYDANAALLGGIMRVFLIIIVLLVAGAAGLYVAGGSFVLINNIGDHTVTLKALADGKPLAQATMHSHQWNWFVYRTAKTATITLSCDDQDSPSLSGPVISDYLSPGKSQGTAIKIQECSLVSTKVLW